MSLIEGVGLYLALLHEGPPEDDWEIRILDEHHLELDSLAPYSDRPAAEVGDAAETVKPRSSIFGDEPVLEGEFSRHVAVAVAWLHLQLGQNWVNEGKADQTPKQRAIMRTFSIGPIEPIKVRTPSYSM